MAEIPPKPDYELLFQEAPCGLVLVGADGAIQLANPWMSSLLGTRVDDIEGTLAELAAKGVRLIDERPRKGAHGNLIAFLHPKSTGGTLIELCQPDRSNPDLTTH